MLVAVRPRAVDDGGWLEAEGMLKSTEAGFAASEGE